MMRRNKLPMVRLSDKERIIVSYITRQLAMVYRNTSGKPVYARNMDQVMKDIFGIKKFCKTLERAMHNEAVMIELMKALDTETLWKICRSKEHYRLLCTLVAMDHQIVKMGKKLNNMADIEPAERPTRKIRKLMKELKRSKKLYRSCVKTFQDIFDIEKVNKRGDGMYEFMSEWLDRNEGDGDLFYEFGDYGFSESAIESMDDYVRSKTRKSRGKKAPSSSAGALNLFDDRFSGGLYDDEEGYEDEEEDDDSEDTEEVLRRLLRSQSREEDSTEDLRGELTSMAQIISAGFDRMANGIDCLYQILTDDEEDADEAPAPIRVVPNQPKKATNEPTIDDMIALTEQVNNGNRPVPGDVVVDGEPEDEGDQT